MSEEEYEKRHKELRTKLFETRFELTMHPERKDEIQKEVQALRKEIAYLELEKKRLNETVENVRGGRK